MSNEGITERLRKLREGEWVTLSDIERPNIHSLAKRVDRTVKVRKQSDGTFLVTCVRVLEGKDEADNDNRK